MSKNDGGSAFPQSGYGQWAPMPGMSLRDYFAAKFAASQVMMTSADRDFVNPHNRYPENGHTVAEKVAKLSYELADAMLAERAK